MRRWASYPGSGILSALSISSGVNAFRIVSPSTDVLSFAGQTNSDLLEVVGHHSIVLPEQSVHFPIVVALLAGKESPELSRPAIVHGIKCLARASSSLVFDSVLCRAWSGP